MRNWIQFRFGLIAILCSSVLCHNPDRVFARTTQDNPKTLPEYVVKAGFIYNFAKYVEWPAAAFEKPQTPIAIGVLGVDPFGEELEKALKSKTVNNRVFVLHRFKKVSDIQNVHLLFVPRTENKNLPAILRQVYNSATLTVGEEREFSLNGGMVSILIEEQKPKLEINLDAVEGKKLRIDSRLLKIATIVKKNE